MSASLFDWANRRLENFDPEFAHWLAVKALQCGLYKHQRSSDDPRLAQKIWGLNFANPVGIAAGFDKNAQVPDALINMGAGFCEVGTVTPRPQKGNDRPRVFRLQPDRAVINRYGFNNQGHDRVHKRLQGRVRRGVLGVNVGANKDSRNRIEDFVEGLRVFGDVADYFTINISSPNTPGLRDLQDPEHLNALFSWLVAARKGIAGAEGRWAPILVKLAPDLDTAQLEEVVACLMENEVDGIILTNTTIKREGLVDSWTAHETGGLSGRPLFDLSTRILAKVYLQTKGAIPLIGVGGIDSGETALAKLEAGASLVQVYTGLVFEGPSLLLSIKKALAQVMDVRGLSAISEITGTQADLWASGGK